MNITDLPKLKNLITLTNSKEKIIEKMQHITTNSQTQTLIEIAKGISREGTTPILILDDLSTTKIEEHIIVITKNTAQTTAGIIHVEPSNEKETEEAIISAALDTRPHIITPHKTSKKQDTFTIGRLDMLESGEHCTIIADTPSITAAIRDASKLREQGINCTLLHCHTLEPFDKHTLLASASATKNIVCTERIAAKIAKILYEHTPAPITTAHNNEFIHAVRQSVKKIL